MLSYTTEDVSYGPMYLFSVCVFSYLHYIVYTSVTNRYVLTQKQQAYVISLFGSTLMTLLSLVSNYYLYTANFNMNRYRFGGGTTNDIVSVLSSACFMSGMVMDSVLGFFNYHEPMKTLSGYPHHFFFILANGLVYYYDGYTLINLFLINELPTMIFAFGNVFPELRNDVLFGTAMFSIRIVYHGMLTLLNITFLPATVVSLPSLIAYAYWFKNWCCKYL